MPRRKNRTTITCYNPDCLNQVIKCNVDVQFCYICSNDKKTYNRIKQKVKRNLANNDSDAFLQMCCSQRYKSEIQLCELQDKLIKCNNCCFWCGIKVELVVRRKNEDNKNIINRSGTEFVLDRINCNDKMHSCNNTEISCYLCNNMRGNLSFDVFQCMIDIFKRKRKTLDLSTYTTKLSNYSKNIDSGGNNSPWVPLRDFYTQEESKRIFFDLYNKSEARCFYTGLPFCILNSNINEYGFMNPSVDRIENYNERQEKTKHTCDNVNLTLSMINRGKSNMNHETFINAMSIRYPTFMNGYKDVNVIFPENHSKNWIENYSFETPTITKEKKQIDNVKNAIISGEIISHNNLKTRYTEIKKKYGRLVSGNYYSEKATKEKSSLVPLYKQVIKMKEEKYGKRGWTNK